MENIGNRRKQLKTRKKTAIIIVQEWLFVPYNYKFCTSVMLFYNKMVV